MQKDAAPNTVPQQTTLSGNVFIFHAFDIGEDIDLDSLKKTHAIQPIPLSLSKHFKNYHIPLAIELPHAHQGNRCMGVKLHNFGALSLTYRIPFHKTLDEVRKELNNMDHIYRRQSATDAVSVFRLIKNFVKQPRFFYHRTSYLVIQVDQHPQAMRAEAFKELYGSLIASMLRFETQSLSEYQRDNILRSGIGYFKGDLIIVDPEAAFVYDDEYEELLEFFEFANVQQLELQYFDRLLDQQLNVFYERRTISVPFKSFLPFISPTPNDPIGDLGRLKVDISVITQRLETSIKLAGEPYYSKVYQLLIDNLDLRNWKDSIDKKLSVIRDLKTVYQTRVDTIREDLLTVLIIVLIFIELIVGILHYLK